MNDSKLIEIIKSLSEDELKQFGHFCRFSTYHKKSLSIKFADYLLSLYPKFNPKRLSNEVLFSKLYPNEPFKQKKLYDQVYFLMRLLEDFLAFIDFKEDTFSQNQHLIASLRKRNHRKAFNKKTASSQQDLDREVERDSNYYYKHFILAYESDNYFLMNNLTDRNDSIKDKARYLDLYYFSSKLRDSCEMISRQDIINEKYDFTLTRDLINVIEENHETYLPQASIRIYLNLFKLLDNKDNEPQFEKCKSIILENKNLFSLKEQKSIFELIMNYCVFQINAGQNKYMLELFKLYKFLLETDILLESGTLSQWTYMNISTLAQRLTKFKWALEFLNNYKDLLPKEHQENAYTCNMANLHFSQGEYKEAMFLLHQVEFVDITYALNSKSTLLKSYYELMEVTPFEHLAKSFNEYIRRNKLMSENAKSVYSNSISYTKKLFGLKLKLRASKRSVSPDFINSLKDRILKDKNAANINWIMEKTIELEKTLS